MKTIASGAVSQLATQVKDSVKLDQEAAPDSTGGVQWTDYNYPPCIKLIHFDPQRDHISLEAKAVIAWIHNLYRLSLFLLLLNLIFTIVAAASGRSPIAILYSVLLLVILGVIASMVMYQGYRGVAAEIDKNKWRFKIGQSLLAIVMLIFAFARGANVHGFAAIGRGGSATWDGLCVTESILWLIAFGIACFTVARVHRYSPRRGYSNTPRDEDAGLV